METQSDKLQERTTPVFNAAKGPKNTEIVKPEYVPFFFYTQTQIYLFHFLIYF
jgi:hypothetical protein